MSALPQKELANGEVWYQPGEKVPNVNKKLFALQNHGCFSNPTCVPVHSSFLIVYTTLHTIAECKALPTKG